MPKKQVSQDRKARIAELAELEKSREKRVRLQIIAGCGALLLLLGAGIGYAAIDSRNQQPDALIGTIGVPAAAARCDPPVKDKATGQGKHVEASARVKYDTVPPSTGSHFDQPAVADRKFYTVADRPKMEVLVHNLEHGYTVLWYDQAAGEAKKAELEKLAEVTNKIDAASGKFIVSAWDPAYGKLPADKKFALSHWSATFKPDKTIATQSGNRQMCGDLSGEVVKKFVLQFPRTVAPEPNAA